MRLLLGLVGITAMMCPATVSRAFAATSHVSVPTPSFTDFDRRARNGEHLNVVFFGASLTWGANATDPPETSYRANVARDFEAAYPEAHFRFWDAAIGGTGSQLGVFRVERDVLRRKPDLVFLDFSANDDIYSDDPDKNASYEAIVRRLIVQARVPVVQVIFPFMWNVKPGEMAKMKRRDAHLAIAHAYNTAVGDAIALVSERVASGQSTLEELWPIDGVHPGDEGYRLFAEAAWKAYRDAVHNKQVCHVPKRMLNANTYTTSARVRLSSLGPLPVGWSVGQPNRVAAYFDFLMSRWLDDETIASNFEDVVDASGKKQRVAQPVERLKLNFQGSTVLFFGETTLKSGKYRVYLDGQLRTHLSPDGKTVLTEYDAGNLARLINGNGHYVQPIAGGLDPKTMHTLEIEPIFEAGKDQELRLESICIAGSSTLPIVSRQGI